MLTHGCLFCLYLLTRCNNNAYSINKTADKSLFFGLQPYYKIRGHEEKIVTAPFIHLILYSMLRLFTTTCLFLFTLVLLSCDKNDLSPEDKVLIDSACGVNDPIKELAWLKTIVDNAEKGPDKGLYAGTVQKVHYQEKTYFIYQKYIMSCMACLVYDCQGNKLDILADPEIHMAIIERMSEKNIIYRSPFN
jgi:hypothetical protein